AEGYRAIAESHYTPQRVYGQPASELDPAKLGSHAAEVCSGVPTRIQACAGYPASSCGSSGCRVRVRWFGAKERAGAPWGKRPALRSTRVNCLPGDRSPSALTTTLKSISRSRKSMCGSRARVAWIAASQIG